MRLLYITNGINGSGGLERVLSVKASYFADFLGYEVTIAVLNNGHLNPFYDFSEKIRYQNLSVRGNPITYLKEYHTAIKKVVKQTRPDIILICDDGLKAFLIPKILHNKTPIVYERHVSKLIEMPRHATLKQELVTKAKWFFMNMLSGSFSAFVVLTQGNTKEWKHLKNIHVIANPNPFHATEKADLNNKKILCVGKVSFQKGQDILAKAWEIVVRKHPDWEMHNYGKLDDTVLSSDQLPQNMYLHPPVKNIKEQYLESSIYVLPSRYEGFGMVLIEAMTFGLPCVAFDCNYGPGDIIHHENNGLLIPTGDYHALAKALTRLIEGEELRKEYGNRAIQDVKNYDMAMIGKQWNELFETLTNK